MPNHNLLEFSWICLILVLVLWSTQPGWKMSPMHIYSVFSSQHFTYPFPFHPLTADSNLMCLAVGGGEAVRAGRSDVWRVPGRSLRRQVRPVLLCQRHMPAVLLRVLLGQHPLARRPRVPQTAGEGGRRPTTPRLLPLELMEESILLPSLLHSHHPLQPTNHRHHHHHDYNRQ